MMDEKTLRSVVASAGRNLHTLSITYISQTGDNKGLVSYREAEPYSYRVLPNVGEVLFVYDISPDKKVGTKSLALVGIEDMKETTNRFVPKFIVEVAEPVGVPPEGVSRLFSYFVEPYGAFEEEYTDGYIVIAPNPEAAIGYVQRYFGANPENVGVTTLGRAQLSASGESYVPVGEQRTPPGRVLNIYTYNKAPG